MKPDPKKVPTLPAIAACPSCGRRPSERVTIGWRPEFEGPTTIACNDETHALADAGPGLAAGVRALAETLRKSGIAPEQPLVDLFEKFGRLTGGAP